MSSQSSLGIEVGKFLAFRLLPLGLGFRGVWIVVALVLVGCGGGSSTSSQLLNGVLIDGPIQGGRVFLDLNGNLVRDEGEPISKVTDASGAFSLDVGTLEASQLAMAVLVGDVPALAKDADDGGLTLAEVGKSAFTLLAPANAFLTNVNGANAFKPAVVSPLTTFVAGEMLNNGLQLDEARAAVMETQGLLRDPLENFIASGDVTTARIARLAAVALGQTASAAAEVSRNEGGVAFREQISIVIKTVATGLPDLVDGLKLRTSGSARSVAELIQAVEGEQGVVAKAADRVAIQATSQSSVSSAKLGPTLAFHDYVVAFKNSVGNPAREAASVAAPHGGEVRFTYTRAIKGFAVRLPVAASEAFLNAMAKNPNVDYIEIDASVSTRQTVQNNVTWGLDRVDQRNLPLSASYSYDMGGSGVRAYVVDTGIRASHIDFGGRVVTGYSVITDGNGTTDCNGHGTHVAGTIGGTTYGIAKSVVLVPVRVLDCAGSGMLSGVIAGIDWVLGDVNRTSSSLINMSLGGGASTSLDAAVAKAVSNGISVIVAAGNENANACNYSPAREPSAITVGATTTSDARASYSNYGKCLDLFAPGSSITSNWYTSDFAFSILNGTSMAAPHVAGMTALLLESSPGITPAQVSDLIKTTATTSKVASAGVGSPNLLLYTLGGNSGGGTLPNTLTISVNSLIGSGSTARKGWQATVSVSVKDSNGNLVSGAVVGGGFTVGGSAAGCTTASNGTCSVKSGILAKNVLQTSYSVSSLVGAGMSHDPAKNTIASLTIKKP